MDPRDDRIAELEAALAPFAALGTVEGRAGRLAFDDGDTVNTDGDTFDEVPDTVGVFFNVPAGAIRAAHAAAKRTVQGGTRD